MSDSRCRSAESIKRHRQIVLFHSNYGRTQRSYINYMFNIY